MNIENETECEDCGLSLHVCSCVPGAPNPTMIISLCITKSMDLLYVRGCMGRLGIDPDDIQATDKKYAQKMEDNGLVDCRGVDERF